MSIIEALILGLIQGLTEFLPVSSSGHLIIGRSLLGVEATENVAFEVVVHAATVCSTITVLWMEIWRLLQGVLKFRWNDEMQYACKILVSMIPVLLVGLFLKDQVEALFGEGVLLVGIMLLITALLLALTHFVRFAERRSIGFGSALVVGIAQAVAVLPGLSRSGSTIATGLLLGVKKEEMAKFSFLMVLVPILGEAFLELVGGDFSASTSGISSGALLAGFASAYIFGLLACKFMIELVKRAKLIWFAAYCAVVGVVAIVSQLV